MTSVWGRNPELPDAVLERVHRHATALGRTLASDDLFLLALTELDAAQPARRALAAQQITTARLWPLIKVEGDRPVDAREGLCFAPAYYLLHGRAQGFAATLGDGVIKAEHVLIALLWDPSSISSSLVWRLRAGRQEIIDCLRDLGVPTPDAALPPQIEIDWGPRVWFDRAQVPRVVDHLRGSIAPGTRWGFNYAGHRAWAIAESSVDLAALVAAARAAE